MSNFISGLRFSSDSQDFYLNDVKIPGVQSVDISYQSNNQPIKHIGMTKIAQVPNGPIQGEATISRAIISDEPFLHLTGVDFFVEGRVLNKQNEFQFGFDYAFLNSYSSSCQIGEIPTEQATFLVLGNVGKYTKLSNNLNFKNRGYFYKLPSNVSYKIYENDYLKASINNVIVEYSQRRPPAISEVYIGEGFYFRPTTLSSTTIPPPLATKIKHDVSFDNNMGFMYFRERNENIDKFSIHYVYPSYIVEDEVNGQGFVERYQKNDFALKIPSYSSIELNLGQYSTNRVISYNLNINIPRNPIYDLGGYPMWGVAGLLPRKVEINWPIEINCTFQIEVDKYTSQNTIRSIFVPKVNDFSLILKDYSTNEIIVNYSFNDMFLIGETYSTNVNENTLINATYRTFLSRPSGNGINKTEYTNTPTGMFPNQEDCTISALGYNIHTTGVNY